MIDVVFSDTAHGNLAAATSSNPQTIEYMNYEVEEYKLNTKPQAIEDSEGIICLGFHWDIGYLNYSEDSEYRMKLPASLYYGHHCRLHPEDEAELLEDGKNNLESLKKLQEFAQRKRAFRIWYGRNAMELCGFYYTCDVLKEYDVDIYAVEIPTISTAGTKIRQVSSLGMRHAAEYGDLVKNKMLLTKEMVTYYSSLWQSLKQENTPLRVVVSDILISVPEDFYDNLIMNGFTEKRMTEAQIVSKIMCLNLGISSGFVEQRIWDMGQSGKIKLIQDGEQSHMRIWTNILMDCLMKR